jgi:hypothetical protein
MLIQNNLLGRIHIECIMAFEEAKLKCDFEAMDYITDLMIRIADLKIPEPHKLNPSEN